MVCLRFGLEGGGPGAEWSLPTLRHLQDDRLLENVTGGFFLTMCALARLTADRYVEPLREGGSLPAIVDTDDGLFVVKFRGAGQGPLALVAELVVGELARVLQLPMPELALIDVDPVFGASEPDPEIQDLLRASHGTNVGIRYLEGAFNFDPRAAGDLVSAELAAEIVWLDAFVTNPDRTARNPNLLIQDRRPWLIDHGAALYHHHDWERVDDRRVTTPFALLADHVLLAVAGDLEAADRRLADRLGAGSFAAVMEAVPDALLDSGERARYVHYFERRFEARAAMVDDALRLQDSARNRVDPPRSYRR